MVTAPTGALNSTDRIDFDSRPRLEREPLLTTDVREKHDGRRSTPTAARAHDTRSVGDARADRARVQMRERSAASRVTWVRRHELSRALAADVAHLVHLVPASRAGRKYYPPEQEGKGENYGAESEARLRASCNVYRIKNKIKISEDEIRNQMRISRRFCKNVRIRRERRVARCKSPSRPVTSLRNSCRMIDKSDRPSN